MLTYEISKFPPNMNIRGSVKSVLRICTHARTGVICEHDNALTDLFIVTDCLVSGGVMTVVNIDIARAPRPT